MARPTILTISTGERIEPGSGAALDAAGHGTAQADETDLRHALRLSVTYALDEGDADLATVAAVKAAEVKAAYAAVWQRMAGCDGQGYPPASPSPSVRDQPVTQETKSDRRQQGGIHFLPAAPFSSVSASSVPVQSPPSGAIPRMGHSPASGNGIGHAPSPIAPEPANAPQKILIHSKSRAVGLTSAALEEVLWKRYRLRSVERLSKSQANAVLHALEHYEQTGRIEIIDPVPTDRRPEQGSAIGITPMERNDEDAGDADGDDEESDDGGRDDWEPRDGDVPFYA